MWQVNCAVRWQKPAAAASSSAGNNSSGSRKQQREQRQQRHGTMDTAGQERSRGAAGANLDSLRNMNSKRNSSGGEGRRSRRGEVNSPVHLWAFRDRGNACAWRCAQRKARRPRTGKRSARCGARAQGRLLCRALPCPACLAPAVAPTQTHTPPPRTNARAPNSGPPVLLAAGTPAHAPLHIARPERACSSTYRPIFAQGRSPVRMTWAR